jgi:hypothetical protein
MESPPIAATNIRAANQFEVAGRRRCWLRSGFLVRALIHSARGECQTEGQRLEMLDQLGRLGQLEIDAQRRDAQGEPAQVVLPGRVLAGVRVD